MAEGTAAVQAEAAEGMDTGNQSPHSREPTGFHYVRYSEKATSTSP